jgi:hypothetical protein
MTTEEIENAIYEKLKTDLPSVSVEKFPDDYRKYRMSHPKGAALISWNGVRYSERSGIQQAAVLTFSVITITKNLRSHAGAYELVDQVRQSLTQDLDFMGWTLTPLSAVYKDVDEQGNWYYESIFMLPDILHEGE